MRGRCRHPFGWGTFADWSMGGGDWFSRIDASSLRLPVMPGTPVILSSMNPGFALLGDVCRLCLRACTARSIPSES